jgi:hypothetical protein
MKKTILSGFCTLLMLVLAWGKGATAQRPEPQKYALLVGINKYKYPDRVPTLGGSLNDLEDIRQVLVGKFQFYPENILVLRNAEATHAAIINAIKTQLIAKARTGDIVIFHFSGHGSQMPDVTGNMISGLDETIVPYDSRDPDSKVFDISGAELHPLLLQLAGRTKNVTFILDSCHSGTLVRGARTRGIAADTRKPNYISVNAARLTRNVGASKEAEPKFAFISAATSRETAFEYFADGKDHGALTYFLSRELRTSRPETTYRDIIDAVSASVNANFPGQHPALEGAEGDQRVFGDVSSLTLNYVRAAPSLQDVKSVTLDVGQVEDATVGSIYDVYPPGSREFAPPERPVARVRISSVDESTSEALLLSGGNVRVASRAVEREHRFGKSRVRLFIDGPPDSSVIQSIEASLAKVNYINVVDKPTLCNMQLRLGENKLETLGADETTLSPPVSASDPAAVERVVAQLKLWAKWFNVLSIRNPQSDITLHLALSIDQTRDGSSSSGRANLTVKEGDAVRATVSNLSQHDVYVAIVDLAGDGSISVIYPGIQGEQEVLKPGGSLVRSFPSFVPEGRSTVTDILKVFASYKPIDLNPLTQGRIRDPDEEQPVTDPLRALLMDSAGVTRDLRIAPADPVELATWTSIQAGLIVKKR